MKENVSVLLVTETNGHHRAWETYPALTLNVNLKLSNALKEIATICEEIRNYYILEEVTKKTNSRSSDEETDNDVGVAEHIIPRYNGYRNSRHLRNCLRLKLMLKLFFIKFK